MTHKFTRLPLEGAFIIEPAVYHDERGYFFESYQQEKYVSAGIIDTFVQDNEANSSEGVMRGLHYQVGPFAQSKLVRTLQGSIFDVLVDIREGSPTYGQWYGAVLSAENKLQLYIPRGFAHGYLALEKNTLMTYKCDNYYSREHEGGIRFDDPTLAIDWPRTDAPYKVSDKDQKLPYLGNHLTK